MINIGSIMKKILTALLITAAFTNSHAVAFNAKDTFSFDITGSELQKCMGDKLSKTSDQIKKTTRALTSVGFDTFNGYIREGKKVAKDQQVTHANGGITIGGMDLGLDTLRYTDTGGLEVNQITPTFTTTLYNGISLTAAYKYNDATNNGETRAGASYAVNSTGFGILKASISYTDNLNGSEGAQTHVDLSTGISTDYAKVSFTLGHNENSAEAEDKSYTYVEGDVSISITDGFGVVAKIATDDKTKKTVTSYGIKLGFDS